MVDQRRVFILDRPANSGELLLHLLEFDCRYSIFEFVVQMNALLVGESEGAAEKFQFFVGHPFVSVQCYSFRISSRPRKRRKKGVSNRKETKTGMR